MSELQLYYDNFKTGYWAEEDAALCPCHGGGYALSEVDTWHKCPIHYAGQLSPDDLDSLSNATPEEIEAAEVLEKAKWALDQANRKLSYVKSEVAAAEAAVKAARAAFVKVQGGAVEAPATPVADDAGSDEDIPF